MLSVGQPASVGVQVQHAVPELLVIAVHLVDHLLRTADQRRAALDEVVQIGEGRLKPEPALEFALGREDRRAYQQQLKHFLAGAYPEETGRKADKEWARLQSKAKIGVDDQGRPVLDVWVGETLVQIGMATGNILSGNAPLEIKRQLLEARLQSELRQASPQGLTETEVARDWELLQKTMTERDSPVATRISPRLEGMRRNRP